MQNCVTYAQRTTQLLRRGQRTGGRTRGILTASASASGSWPPLDARTPFDASTTPTPTKAATKRAARRRSDKRGRTDGRTDGRGRDGKVDTELELTLLFPEVAATAKDATPRRSQKNGQIRAKWGNPGISGVRG